MRGQPSDAAIRTLPKAELHVHIEGTLEPERLLELAGRHGVALPFRSVDDLRRAYRFTNLQSFLDLYYAGIGVLRTEADFHELTRAYLERARRDGVRHAEVFFDAQAHTRRGLPFAVPITGIRAALDAGGSELGMTTALILCFLRDLGEDAAMATLEQALPFRDWLVGVGLDSAEAGHPPRQFARVFARARAEGLRLVAHAGEEGPPAYVTEALDVLGVERVDHGVRAEEDPALVDRLARDGIPLTVCPVSNVRLGVVPAMEAHPLKRLLDRGVRVTINSDDPAYFGGYVSDNYVAATHALRLGWDDLRSIAAHGFEASFIPAAEKRGHLAELDAYVANARA